MSGQSVALGLALASVVVTAVGVVLLLLAVRALDRDPESVAAALLP